MTASATEKCTIDLPATIMIGGTFRFLSMRLTDGGVPGRVGEEVLEWVQAFARPSSEPVWSAGFFPELPRDAVPPAAPLMGNTARGTTRERILHATAATIREKSYRDASVADIAGGAGVSRRRFYDEFSSKAEAFRASYQHGFQQTLAAVTPAFFDASTWPDRVWHGAQAFTRFLAREPLIAYLGFVECHATGPDFAPRVHDTQLAFTLFLEDGYRERPQARTLSRACSALTAAAVIELGFQISRRGTGALLRRVQPLAVYISLAPFVGLDAAGEFVMGKLSAHASGIP
jgi:AcrR family transcriptional regulator